MKPILLVFFSILLGGLIACDEGSQPEAAKPPASPAPAASLSAFTDTLKKLGTSSANGIDSALQLYSVLAPYDSTGADSAAAALMAYLQAVVEKENNRQANDTTDLSPLLDPANGYLSEKLKAFDSRLHQNHLKPVSDGEGGVYFVPAYETVLPTLTAKTSQPVDNCLNLLAREDTAATFKDAGLAIEMPELVDRLILSEELLSQKMPVRFLNEAKRLNRFYTHALISGADNSPAIDGTTFQLTEEFRKGYEYLLAKYPASKAAAKINVWMAVVKTGDKRKIDDYIRLLN